MDRSWMYNMSRASKEYSKLVDGFIDTAVANEIKTTGQSNLRCPCCDCRNARRLECLSAVKDHLVRRGFVQNYTTWTWHGEYKDYSASSSSNPVTHRAVDSDDLDDESEESDESEEHERIDDMLHDVEANFAEQPHIFDDILRASMTELYPGCPKYTTLSAVLKFFNLKSRHGMTDECFTDLLELLADMFPDENTLPTSTYKAKKLMCPMGVEYEKIHACPKDCVLFRNEHKDLDKCPRCGSCRYKNKSSDGKKQHTPAKVLWYLPVIPRFKRLFADENTAKLLRWHNDVRKFDGLYRHPADAPQWRGIDVRYPDFGDDARNLRLGLCTDGMSPYGTLSTTYST